MNSAKTTRLLVSPVVARLVKGGAHDERLAAIHGSSPLSLKDRLDLCLCLFQHNDPGLQSEILSVLGALAGKDLAELLADMDLHPRHLELIARARLNDVEVISVLLEHPVVSSGTLINIARHCCRKVLILVAKKQRILDEYPQVVQGLLANGRVDSQLKLQLGLLDEELLSTEGVSSDADEVIAPDSAEDGVAVVADEKVTLSKYQMALELSVGEKIKLALTGDKEWRSLFIKDANKLVSSGVLKNPRITDGEVLAVAKSKSSNDELIRLITMNNEWLKNYEIKRALVMHNRTPLPKALRFMGILSEKDIKALAKSREISSVIANAARRMLIVKEQKK
jgi:hypothetical protein